MGGNAIKSSSRINQENVASTIDDINNILIPHLNIKSSDTSLLGSTGKKLPGGSSGDIDLAVSCKTISENNNLTSSEIFDFIIEQSKKFTHEIKDLRQIGLISIAWPISNYDGKQDGLYVQLDLMLVDSIDWATWAYYSPAEWESSWKGLYANEFLFFIAKHSAYKVIKSNENGEYIEVERYFFDISRGLMKGVQTYQGIHKLLKKPKTLSKELVSDNIEFATRILFGDNIKPSEIRTYEGIMKIINDSDRFRFYKDRKIIFMEVAQGILNKGYPIPKDLQEEL